MDWINKIKTDANAALETLYNTYRDECIIFIKNTFQLSEVDAVEVFQLSVIVLYDSIISEKLTKLDVQIKTYLLSIAKNKCYELFRLKKKEVITDDVHLLGIVMADDHEADITDEQIIMMSHFLNTLGNPCTEILQLFYFHNKKMEEITEIMNYKNADTTKNLKYKCLKRLQSIFFSHYKQK